MDAYERAVEKVNRCKPCNSCNTCIFPIGIPGPMGPTGPMGPQGLIGPTGPAPNFTIGSVTTGEPGTQAIVTITPVFVYQNAYYNYKKGEKL